MEELAGAINITTAITSILTGYVPTTKQGTPGQASSCPQGDHDRPGEVPCETRATEQWT